MQNRYLHVRLPHRGPFYFAFGVGLIFAFWLGKLDTSFVMLLPVSGFLAAVFWFAFRDTPSGVEISGGEWRCFVGRQSWKIPLVDIASVRRRPEGGLVLTLRNGKVTDLPATLQPDPGPLGRELRQRGIAFVG